MASIARTPKGSTRILFYDKDGYRKAIYLGRCSKADSEKIKHRVESVLAAGILGQSIDQDDATWLAKFPKMREKFELVGLVEPSEPAEEKDSPTLADFLDDYLKRKSPSAKPGTVAAWRQVVDALKKHMPKGIRMDKLTAGHATAFVDKLKQSGIANSTIANRVTKSKQFFADAVEWRIIETNPFENTKKPPSGKKSNVFVKRQDIAKVMAKANIRWKTIIALSRFGGLRCPSETLSLKWTDIDFETRLMRIPEPKVEHHDGRGVRECPIFPELYDVLLVARAAAPQDTEYVVDAPEYRAAANTGDGWKNANLRTQFLKLLKKAGVERWPRLFHSMRASRQTELHEEYPLQAVCAWIGNSEEVAKSNYLLMREEYISKATGAALNATRAAETETKNVGVSVQKQRGSEEAANDAGEDSTKENTGENLVSAVESVEKTTDGEGFEVPSHPPGNSIVDGRLGTKATRSTKLLGFEAAIDLRLGELLELWELANDEQRDEYLQGLRERVLTSKGVQS
jgi:integrase